MDFPKSVEGSGLVGGRFIDENPVTGQQGSLIAAAWGNQVTDEILNVVKAAKLTPSEQESDQLLKAIKAIITANMPTSLSDWKDIDNKPLAVEALTNIVTISTTGTLTNEQLGLILIDASASDVALTLPQTSAVNKTTELTVFRLDNSTHKVTIKSATTETIYFNTKLNTQGYGFFYLMGAGDYWRLISNGEKGWYKLGRKDETPLGRVNFDTTIEAAEGGYLIANGSLLSRTEYPWLWDYAQKSGMLVEETARTGYEGCFTKGDGATTFRIPDLRGTFLRVLDNGSSIDTGRVAGSWQKGSLSFVDTGSAGVWGSYDTTRTDTIDVALKKAGLDDFNADKQSSYNGIRMAGAGAASVVDLPGTGGDLAYAGVSRPNNIAYPIYLKII